MVFCHWISYWGEIDTSFRLPVYVGFVEHFSSQVSWWWIRQAVRPTFSKLGNMPYIAYILHFVITRLLHRAATPVYDRKLYDPRSKILCGQLRPHPQAPIPSALPKMACDFQPPSFDGYGAPCPKTVDFITSFIKRIAFRSSSTVATATARMFHWVTQLTGLNIHSRLTHT